MPEVNGDLIVLKVRPNSTPGSTTFKQVICTDTVTFNMTNDVSKRKTSCGTKTSLSDVDFNVSGSGVYNTTQSSAQCSWDDVKEWQKSKTKLDFMFINLADAAAPFTEGSAVSAIGSGFFTSSSFTGSAEEGFATFDFTLEGTGTLDSYDI